MELLENINASTKPETAIILVTHRIQAAREANMIFVLENGKISAKGNHDELLKGNNMYSDVWRDISKINV